MASGEDNAFTNNDYTNFYLTLPVDNLETALWLESDRMQGLWITPEKLETEKRVVIEEFREEGNLISIRAEIFCERASHKGIIVGKNGASLKLIGTYAREDLEKMLGTKVYLNLWVKVKENWRESARTVGNFGYREEN